MTISEGNYGRDSWSRRLDLVTLGPPYSHIKSSCVKGMTEMLHVWPMQ